MPGVDEVRQREVHQPVQAAERHRRLGPVRGQRRQPLSRTAGEHHAEHLRVSIHAPSRLPSPTARMPGHGNQFGRVKPAESRTPRTSRQALDHADLGLLVPSLLPVVHVLPCKPSGGQVEQGLGAVVEVLAQHLVLAAPGRVESEVEHPAGDHDPPDVPQALVDDRQRGVREHAVRVHDVEVIVGQEPQPQVADQAQVRQLALQAVLADRVVRGQQDVGRDVDAVVVAGVQIVDEQAAGAQVAAADLQHPHVRLQAVLDQVVELHLPDPQPGLAVLAPDGGVAAAGRVRPHDGPVVLHMIAGGEPQPGVTAAAAGVGRDAVRVLNGVARACRPAASGPWSAQAKTRANSRPATLTRTS